MDLNSWNSIEVLKEALGATDDAEGAEYVYLEEANIAKMDNLYEKESETSDEEAANYNCAFCQKMYIHKTELCDVEKNKESEEDGKIFLVPTANNSLALTKK